MAALGWGTVGGACGGGQAMTGPDAGGTGGAGSGGAGTGSGGAGAGGTSAGTGGAGTGTGGAGTGTGGAGTGGAGTGGGAGAGGTGGAGSGGRGSGGSSGGGSGGSSGGASGGSSGGASGSGGAGGDTISYAGCMFIGGVNRLVIAKRDTARDLCVVLVLASPVTNNPFNLTLPPSMGMEYAYAMPAQADCRQRNLPPGAASAIGGTGSVVSLPTPQPTYNVDVTFTFQPDSSIGVGASERLMATSVLASVGCP
jgi:hypothetical protein